VLGVELFGDVSLTVHGGRF